MQKALGGESITFLLIKLVPNYGNNIKLGVLRLFLKVINITERWGISLSYWKNNIWTNIYWRKPTYREFLLQRTQSYPNISKTYGGFVIRGNLIWGLSISKTNLLPKSSIVNDLSNWSDKTSVLFRDLMDHNPSDANKVCQIPCQLPQSDSYNFLTYRTQKKTSTAFSILCKTKFVVCGNEGISRKLKK